MEVFIEWITKIVLFLFLAMIADALLPSGLMKKYARFVMSILLIFIFLGPIFQLLQVDPARIMSIAEYEMDQQMNGEQLDETIEKKKNEILEGQAAYKLEQVSQGLKKELEGPLKEELGVNLVNLELIFKGDQEQAETMEKMILTLSESEGGGAVQEVDISLSGKDDSTPVRNVEPEREWVAKYLHMEKDQIEIRWEENDE